MLIVLNPRAGGGAATRRWELIRGDTERLVGPFTEIRLDRAAGLDDAVAECFGRGERRFVGAGGDGTVNALVNSLMRFRAHAEFRSATLGAIGLGSSNDFHKPGAGVRLRGIPLRLDFRNAGRHDVGCIEAPGSPAVSGRNAGTRRYFLVNASLGVTAEGNALFNRESGLIACLKRISTTAAISWAALSAILRHVNLDVRVSLDGGPESNIPLSNLAVLKNPHISGGMRAPLRVGSDDGMLRAWIEKGLSRRALFGLFLMLSAGRYTPGRNSRTGPFSSLRVKGARPFPVECDGEIFYSDDVKFSLLPGAVQVCR